MGKLIDFLILDNPLLEMPFHRHDVRKKVRSYARKISEHVLYLCFYGRVMPDSARRWVVDVDKMLRRIAKSPLKPDGKMFKSDEYFEWLYDEPFTPFEKIAKSLMREWAEDGKFNDAPVPDAPTSFLDLEKKVESFYSDVCSVLSSGSYSLGKLNDLVKKYLIPNANPEKS